MADISFYKYLEAAFRYRLFNPQGQRANLQTKFNALGYNLPYERIFYYTRRLLPKFYTDTSRFPDTEEGNLQMAKEVLEKLDKHQDTQLENQFKAVTISEENAQVIVDMQAESQQTEAGLTQMPADKTTSSFGRISMPSAAPTKQIFGVRNIKPPSWLKTFGSNAQIFARKNLGKVTGGLLDIAKGVGRGIAGPGLTGTYNLLGKAANGGLNTFERITRPGGIGGGGIGKGLSKSSNKFALGFIGIMLFFVLFGSVLGGLTGTTPTGEAAPIAPISTDISSCKFTRGDMTPKEASFQSNLLLGYIQEAASKSSIPPAVLAAFIRVESPASSNMPDEQIANYSANCEQSPTGALGIMQIQPSGTTSLRGDPASCDDCIDAGAKLVGKTVFTMTKQDYCDPRTNIIVGAGWILKKMSKLGYGDGTRWNPEWTNNRTAIEALVDTYYGCVNYGGAKDCTGPYNYADDVSKSIQNCQATSGSMPPPADGNYKKWVGDFGININDGFVPDVYRWAYEVLATTPSIAPKFKILLGSSIEVKPSCDISHTSGRVISLRNRKEFCPSSDKDGPTAEESIFKQVFIHELGHIINGSYRPGKFGDKIKSAIAAEGYLTAYSQNAATAGDEICGAGNLDTRADEDFAESISYFINININERDYGCGVSVNQNPIYTHAEGELLKPKHYQLMVDLLR